MPRNRALLLALLFSAAPAHAFFDPPWITQSTPRAGDDIFVNIRGGLCDSIFFRPGYPQITREGNAIRVVEYGHHWETPDLCIYDTGTLVEPIGSFPPGDYTVTVDFFYENYPFGYTTVTIGVVPFSVAGAESDTSVPSSGTPANVSLAVLVFVLALRSLLAKTPVARTLAFLARK